MKQRYAAAAVLAGFAAASVVAAEPASAAPSPTSTSRSAPTPSPTRSPAQVGRRPVTHASTATSVARRRAGSAVPERTALTIVRGWRFKAVPKPKPVFDVARAAGVAAPPGPFAPSSVPYVGPYSPQALLGRMRLVMARNGSGENADPFFGSEPDGSWYRDCQHFVATLDGRSTSGFGSASSAWYHFLAIGAAHPASSADGMRPPAGAWLYYGDNHVVVYLGDNLVAGTDTWGVGSAKIGPAVDVQNWLAGEGGYRGWVAP